MNSLRADSSSVLLKKPSMIIIPKSIDRVICSNGSIYIECLNAKRAQSMMVREFMTK